MARVDTCSSEQVIASAVRIGYGMMMDGSSRYLCGCGQVIASAVMT